MTTHNSLRALFSFIFLFISTHTAYSFRDQQLKIEHGPYLVEPGENSMTVLWFTNKKSVSWVEYCGDDKKGTFPVWGGYPKIAKSSHHGLIDANTKMHSIRITGLEQGKKYRYRVVSKEILRFDPYEVLYGDTVVGEVYEFETLDPTKKQFSFGVITDVHERSDKLDVLFNNLPIDSLDMMIHTGDTFNWMGEEERIFNGFLDVSVDHYAKQKPMIMARGNHETRGPEARGYFNYFPHSSGKYYYSFRQGDVYFLILDSGEDKADDHPVYGGLTNFDAYRSEQAEWLKKEVQCEEFKNSLYKIALFHIPLYTKSTGHGNIDLTEKWGPILNDAKVDLVINGHTHRYSKVEKQRGKNNFPILVIGQDMMLKTDVSSKQLSLTIKDGNGALVDKYIVRSKK